MLLPRRISEKKCRFTAKKVTFLEYQRVKRSELTKNITERKRLGSVLFLPEVGEEVGTLSHESVQRILHQGTLFHTVRTSLTPQSNNASGLSCTTVGTSNDGLKGTLDGLLYGKIFNVRCLSNHDLGVLLTYMINVSELSKVNLALLQRVLEQAELNFGSLSISEISHILYSISQLLNRKPKLGLLFDRSCNIVKRALKLLFTGGSLSSINFISSSNIAKLVYSLSDPVFHSLSFKYNDDLTGLLSLYSTYLRDNKNNSKDFALICKSMVRLDFPDYELLSTISDFYSSQLYHFNSNFRDFNLSTSSNSLDRLSLLDKSNEKVDVKELFVLLETSDHFGFNHKGLLEEFNEYLVTYTSMFSRFPDPRSPGKGLRKKRLLELIKNSRYSRSGRLDLSKIYSEMTRLNPVDPWDPSFLQQNYKYVTKRSVFMEFMENRFGSSDHLAIRERDKWWVDDTPEDFAPDEGESSTIEKFLEAVKYLPKVVNFKDVPKVFRAIANGRRMDLVPVLYSYLQESSLIFEDLEGLSDSLLDIFGQILSCGPDRPIELDNICKIVHIFTQVDLKRDYMALRTFSNLFNIFFETCKMEPERLSNLDQCGSLTFAKEVLQEYFTQFPKVKVLEFDRVPSRSTCYRLFRFIPSMKGCAGPEDMMGILEELGGVHEDLREAVDLNRDVFKFVIYNGFMEGMAN